MDSVHRLLRRRLQHSRACRSRGEARPGKPHSPSVAAVAGERRYIKLFTGLLSVVLFLLTRSRFLIPTML
ncbi:MAG: hypothetical protein V3V19_03695 [Cocleimonas sp.]